MVAGREGVTFLESKAIGRQAARTYRRELQRFLDFANKHQLRLSRDSEVDTALTRYFNAQYDDGEIPSKSCIERRIMAGAAAATSPAPCGR